MFVKILVICAVLAAAHASLIAPVGYGAPVLTAGHLAISKGLIAAPALAAVSSQKSVINHVTPAPAPITLASHGVIANGLVGGHGAAPLTVNKDIYGGHIALGVGSLGLGHGTAVSSQKSVIQHVAPLAVSGSPIGLANHGIIRGHGIAASPLAVGKGIYGSPVAHGVGSLGLGYGAAVSSQKSVIKHVAPISGAAAPISLGTHGIVGGHGIAAAPLPIGKRIYGAPVAHGVGSLGFGHGAVVSSQQSAINHVATAARVAAAPVGLASHGIVGAHGIAAAPLAVGPGIYGAPVAHGVGSLGLGHGAVVSSQKSVINHVAPAARVAVAAAPVGLASHGIVGAHGITAAPLAVGAGIYGAPVAHGVENLGLGHGAVVSSQKSVINQVAPAAPIGLASHGIYGNGFVAGHGLLTNGLVGGHGNAAAPLTIGNGLHGAPVALGHGAAVSSQKSVISHVAPSSHVTLSAAPVALSHTGVFNNGHIGGHGFVDSGLISGHGISGLPLSIGNGIHSAPVTLGKTLF